MVEDAVEAIGFGTFQLKLSILTGLSWVRPASFDSLLMLHKHTKIENISFACPFCQMADAMEMMILSILAPQLHCEWKLLSLEVALLTSVKAF